MAWVVAEAVVLGGLFIAGSVIRLAVETPCGAVVVRRICCVLETCPPRRGLFLLALTRVIVKEVRVATQVAQTPWELHLP